MKIEDLHYGDIVRDAFQFGHRAVYLGTGEDKTSPYIAVLCLTERAFGVGEPGKTIKLHRDWADNLVLARP